MSSKLFTGIILIMAIISNTALAQNDPIITWEKVSPIPPAAGEPVQYGVAGALAGFSHNMLIVAGGANFGDSVPWRGGKKHYHDEIFLLTPSPGEGKWVQSKTLLPKAVAYSSCVSFADRLICIGGEDAAGPVNQVISLENDSGKIRINQLTPLPQPVTSGGAALIENIVYLAGGAGKSGAIDEFYSADLNREELVWLTLPKLPIPLSNAVVVSQDDGNETCIYVLGGRNKTNIISKFYPDIWKYSPSKMKWAKVGELVSSSGEPLGLSAGTGVAAGKNHIILFGGDVGIVFNRTERLLDAISKASNEEEKQALIREKNSGLENHPGFPRTVFDYNTISGKTTPLAEIPGPGQVTTIAAIFGTSVYIPSGEIRPGIRTPVVTKAVIQLKDLK